MKKLERLKLKNKLVAIILSITIIILAVAFTAVIIYNRQNLRESFINKAQNIAIICGTSMISQISFGNPKEGTEDLETILKKVPEVQNAWIFNDRDALFASYHKSEFEMAMPPFITRKASMQINEKYLDLYTPILYNGIKYGSLFLRISVESLNKQIQNLIFAMIIIILASIPLSLFLATKLQAIISVPIVKLGKVAQRVSSEGNYSVRVSKTTHDEVGMLYDNFNDMMAQIHKRDIYRDKVEYELKAAEFFLTSVLESMPIALITINQSGIVSHWNKAAVHLTGIEAGEAKEKNLWELLPDFQKYREKIKWIFQSKKTLQYYKDFLKINGNSYYLDVTVFPLLNSHSPKHVIMINNVTEMELKDQQLRQSQKMETVGTLAGGLAHDFNNVLGGIIGTISLFKYKVSQQREVTQKDIEKYFTTIEESASRASDMVQHLLSLTRKHEMTFAPTDLNAVIRSTVKICRNTFDKSIEIVTSYSEANAITFADSTQIEQSLLNLYINAAHAMTIMRGDGEKYGGKLNISLEKLQADKYFFKLHPEAKNEQCFWRISVQDSGVGMGSKILSKIFDPFFTTKGEGKGTGLGLAMVYNIIKQHKGFIDVYSQEGIGTTFHIYLPFYESKTVKKNGRVKEKINKGEGCVLIIDDEDVMRQTAKSILEECGYEILLAENGEEGVEMYRTHSLKIKAVLLDMVMPKMTGKQAYQELIKINKDVKVLLASGFKQDSRVEALLEQGVKAFIQKPFGMERLANSIYNTIHDLY